MYAIIIVHKPTGRLEAEPEWNNFLEQIGQIKESFSKTQEIQENVYQIDLDKQITEFVNITSVDSVTSILQI